MEKESFLEIKDLTVTYPDGASGLREVTLKVEKGEFVLLAGPTGSGKSTLAYALLNVIPRKIRAQKTGQIFFKGNLLNEMPVYAVSLFMQMVLQNADAMLFGVTVRENIQFGLENLQWPEEKILSETKRVADLFDVSHLLDSSPVMLSSGEKQRAALAACFAMGSELFVLDEPFTYLDDDGRRELALFLRKLKEAGKTVILIEHHFKEVAHLIDRICILEDGRLKEVERKDEYLKEERFSLIPSESSQRRFQRIENQNQLVIQDLSFGYREGETVFKNFSFSSGNLLSRLPLLGPNGCGKTTLAFLLAGLLTPSQGSACFSRSAKKMKTCCVFQRPEAQLFCRSVEEELISGLTNLGFPQEECRQKADAMMTKLNLAGKRKVHPQNLSRGEKRRLAFGAALIMEPDVLILDEPTVGQDSRSLDLIQELIDEYSEKGMQFLILTHDDLFAREISDVYLHLSKDRKLTLEKWRSRTNSGEESSQTIFRNPLSAVKA